MMASGCLKSTVSGSGVVVTSGVPVIQLPLDKCQGLLLTLVVKVVAMPPQGVDCKTKSLKFLPEVTDNYVHHLRVGLFRIVWPTSPGSPLGFDNSVKGSLVGFLALNKNE